MQVSPSKPVLDKLASDVLGYTAFKVDVLAIDCDNEIKHIISASAAAGASLLRVESSPSLPTTVLSAPWFTGYPLANVVTFCRVLDSVDVGVNVVPGADASCVVVPKYGPTADLVHLLPEATDGAPFKHDPALTHANTIDLLKAALLDAVNNDSTTVLKCRLDDATVGFCAMRLDHDRGDPCAVIDLLVVSHNGWRRGAGSLLLRHASDAARAGGAQSLTARIPEHQRDSVDALKAHGFQQTGSSTLYHVWLPSKTDLVRFNVPHITGRELSNLKQAVQGNALDSLGPFTHACQAWMQDTLQSPQALLTHSATAALEQAAMLCGLGAGDEVIMPSYTFVSTASCVVLRGATPVFVDVDATTLNIDAARIKDAITPRTKAIIAVHYAGVPCDMDAIMALATQHKLYVIEDAAQAFMSQYKGRYLGTIGHFGCFSFHYTKNTVCGEGGALLVNDTSFAGAAPIVREKGTNRSDFINKKVAKYEWVGLGSSFEPCELSAAFLLAQLEDAPECARRRRRVGRAYRTLLLPAHQAGKFDIMADTDADDTHGNGHIFWVLFTSVAEREAAEKFACSRGVQCFTHYVPLHLSPAGSAYGRYVGDMQHTIAAGSRLLRLPMWAGMNWTHVHRVVSVLLEFVGCPRPTQKDTMRLFMPGGNEKVHNNAHGATARVTIVKRDASLSPKRVPLAAKGNEQPQGTC